MSEKSASGLIGCSWLQHSAEHMAFVKTSQKLLLTLSSLFSRPLNSYLSGIEHCRDPLNDFWHLDSIGRRGAHSRHKRFFFCGAAPELIKLSWNKHLGNFVNKDNLVSQWEKPKRMQKAQASVPGILFCPTNSWIPLPLLRNKKNPHKLEWGLFWREELWVPLSMV